jgi:hypothetical protein
VVQRSGGAGFLLESMKAVDVGGKTPSVAL